MASKPEIPPPEQKNEYEAKINELKASEAAKENERKVVEAAKVIRQFAALGSPTAEANFSRTMFLQKYFLDEAGKPDQSRTPEPIPLPGLLNRAKMHAAAERIRGLKTYSEGEGEDRTLVIGWALKLQQAEQEEWNQLMQQHELFVSQARSQDPAAEFYIHQIGGIYIIKCDEMNLVAARNSYNNTMRLEIIENGPEGCVGIFDFGVLEGIMLLDESKENLALRVASLECEAQQDSSGEDDDSGREDDGGQEDDDDNQIDENTNNPSTPKKRKANSIEEAVSPPSKKSKQMQKQKQSKANGGTIYLQWRGIDTGEGEIQLDYGNKHVGQLNFSDNAGFAFEGTANLESVGNNIRFQGWRIQQSLGGDSVTRSWNDYSEAAHERARVARWH